MSCFCVVLVRPRDPNNIGAAARAMGNFGLTDLRVVDPYPPVWREAVSAVGVSDILQNARKFDTLDEALADTHFSLASTALKNRRAEQEVVTLPHLNERLQTAPRGLTALVFGNEKSGLSGEDIARCEAVLNIPTSAKQPSINLAQAVILTCYELSRRADFMPVRTVSRPVDAATDAQKEIFIAAAESLCEKTALRADLTPAQRKAFLRHALARQSISKDQLFFLKKLAEKISALLP
uniref:tRNA (Cytidine/uridine-2'-O-)-methyltransferase TrmJ n=1 Tax=uncultured Elusimicrobia bacterium TaxID=699876 RepID=A0A650ELU2_9BACT|nr:tRNA (cytidine/uridine-2'-O-)-methyltransferase TrmJ [uncultured Elusimicrobia bacterium]